MVKKYFKTFDLCYSKDGKKFVKLVYNFGDGTAGFDYIPISDDDFAKFTDLEQVWFNEKVNDNKLDEEKNGNGK